MPLERGLLYCDLGLAVSTVLMWLVDLGSRHKSGSNHSLSNYLSIFLDPFSIIRIIRFIHIMSQVNALLQTLELQESAQRKGHFSLFKSIVWCWGTPSTGVCSGFTAIRFR